MTRPIQNPHSQKTRDMRRDIVGQEFRRLPKNLDLSAETEKEMLPNFKSPWFRRVLKRIRKK